ncbi:hypothetical protein EUX98_g8270 [Antrodiella citrinella]|uniref:Myosin-binding domain-containing protein n=1 Tax=Antrodiella citrinella TaxID=2447956 RepID=A0A4S4M902_9APHY|nr:hypothetical protein EUX98_g8270 [Antrodiella citrinella]
MSAPTSPSSLSKLVEVQEELGASDDDEYPIPELSSEYFGMAALDLRRKRQSAGLSALRMSRPPSYTNHAAVPMQSTLSLPAASRFTQGQTSRHPLSVSALRLALHGALSAKRYACSHLLALRFEDDDVTYWEDVRSMMALLTTTFSDASARLTEALDESETKRLKDERPSPSDSPSKITPSKSMQEMVGFAPMPNHLTRFATHVDAISTALDDARAHLEQCVASLRDPLKRDASADPFLDEDTSPIPPTESPVLQAYDRLRKELGFALRECERGREHLLHTIMPPSSNLAHLTDGEDEGDNVPSLVPDTATSDGGASAASSNQLAPTVLSVIEPDNGLGLNVAPDDATEHLLMSTSTQHLPPPGVEQVYEADSGIAGVFTREKSKMSREERIKLAKEKRRESSGTAFPSGQDSFVAPVRWAPEGEVVQELKDVIWKVSEKRRRMSEQVKASAGAAVSHATGVADAEGLSAPPLTEDVDAEADVVFSVTVDPVSSSDDAQSSSDFPTYPHLAAAALESSIHEDVQLAYLDS